MNDNRKEIEEMFSEDGVAFAVKGAAYFQALPPVAPEHIVARESDLRALFEYSGKCALHLDPASTGNPGYQNGEDHLGHNVINGRCTKCTLALRDMNLKRRCGEAYFVPRHVQWCPHCARPDEDCICTK